MALRKELLATPGSTPGPRPSTITWPSGTRTSPSVSTIWRVLKARGFVTPQPHKRPKSSCVRFEADFPNESWQADMTHVAVADGAVFEVLNMIDDHSRLCVASRVFVTTRAPDVVRTLHKSGRQLGLSRVLPHRQRPHLHRAPPGRMAGPWRLELSPLGHPLQALTSLPSPDLRQGRALPPDHEEVPGQAGPARATKTAAGPARPLRPCTTTPIRPHRALDRAHPTRGIRRPRKGHPTGPSIDTAGYRVRHDKVDKTGR